MAFLLILHCPYAWQAAFLAPDPLLKWLKRGIWVMFLLLLRTVYPSAGALSPTALIFKPPWPKHISQQDIGAVWLGQEVGWGRQGERLLCSRLIRFHRTPQNYQSVGLYTQHECLGVKARVVCLGRGTQESIAGSEGNVSLSAESIHSHQTGSLSIMGELREHTLSALSASLCLCWPSVWWDHYCSCKGFRNRDRGRCGETEG